MTSSELEQLLEGGTETQSLDFKRSSPWDEKVFAKDFMAMANIDGGGTIIVGVMEENEGYVLTGVTDEHKKTYVYDIMKDQIAKYADPFIEFSVEYVQDSQSRTYVVMGIQPFIEIPVISKKKTTGIDDATIYFRTRSKRPQSAPIANSTELRDILERAAINIMRRYDKLGLKATTVVTDLLKKERGDL